MSHGTCICGHSRGKPTKPLIFRGRTIYIRDYLLACFLDSFETNKIRCKIHVTYQFVVAQPNVPAITAPLFHGKPREETDTSHPHPTAIPPTPQLLYSPCTTEGRLLVGSLSLPKKETARVSKINPSAFKGKNFVTNSLYCYALKFPMQSWRGVMGVTGPLDTNTTPIVPNRRVAVSLQLGCC